MDNRGAFRFPSDVEVQCRSCDRSWGTRLVNISTTGCMIACPEDSLPHKALLRLRVKGLTAIDGEIVWQHRNHAGVRFKVPLHPAVMEHLAARKPDEVCGTDARVAAPVATIEPIRGATSLHAELVKRTWVGQDDPEPRRASAH
jgi:hypothetical protein